MTDRRRIALLAVIVALVSAGSAATAHLFWWNDYLRQQHAWLAEKAKARVHLLAAAARFVASEKHLEDPHEILEAALGHLRRSGEMERLMNLSGNGEVCIGRKDLGVIRFYFSTAPWHGPGHPRRISPTVDYAEPMRRALEGQRGIHMGLDQHGRLSLSAYEPMAFLEAGLVVRTDMEGMEAPFYQSAFYSALAALALTLLGVVLFVKLGRPMIGRLEESQTRLSSIVGHVTDLVVILDEERRFSFISPSARRFGFDPASLIGESLDSYIHVDDLSQVMAAWRRARRFAGLPQPVNMFRAGQDAMWRWLEGVLNHLPQEAGIQGTLFIGHDVTEREMSQRAFMDSEARYRNLFETAPMAFVLWDVNGRITSWNKQAEEIFGWPEEETLGRDLFDLLVPKDEQQKLLLVAGGVLHGEQVTGIINRNRTKSGREIVCQWYNSPQMRTPGEVTGGISLAVDITERIRYQEEMDRLNQILAGRNRELQQILFVASHDLRSPLVNVRGYGEELAHITGELSQMVRAHWPEDAKRQRMVEIFDREIPECLSFIHGGAERMDRLLSGLLRLSRLGRAALQLSQLDMDRIVADALNSVGYRAEHSDVRVHLRPLPPCWGDAMLAHRIFVNLLENALKYLDPERPGEIIVAGSREGGRVFYQVIDNGQGIDPVHHGRVFEIFARLDGAPGSGSGLGLTIVQWAAARMGGEVRLQSELGQGCRFTVILPAEATGAPSL